MPPRRALKEGLPHSFLGYRNSTWKRGRPAAVGSPTGCRRASWKVRKKSGAGDERQTSPPPLELTNRYQALAEESDSEDETEDEWEDVPFRLTGKQGVKPLPVTTAHTGNRVMADGGREPPKVVPQINNKQPRPAEGTVITQGVTQRRGRAKPTQSDLTKSKLQAQQSALTDQVVSGKEDGLAISTEGMSETRSSKITNQSAPEDGHRSRIWQETGYWSRIWQETGHRSRQISTDSQLK